MGSYGWMFDIIPLFCPDIWTEHARPTERLGWRGQEVQHAFSRPKICVNDLQQSDAEPRSIQASHVRSAEYSNWPYMMVELQLAKHFRHDTSHFQLTQATEVVDHYHNIVLRVDAQESPVLVVPVEQLRQQHFHELGKVGSYSLRAGLIMDAHSDLDLLASRL